MNDPEPEPNLNQIGASEILNSLADGAYITNRSRKIVFWSRAAERITGWSAAEVVGHNCSDNILVHVDKDGHQLCGFEHCPLHRAISTGQMSSEPVLVFAQHKKGHRVPVEVSVAPLQDKNGNTLGGVEVFRDLTDAVQDLRRAKVIQEHALASSLPVDDRLQIDVSYSPEELVGGDFYRIERLDADTYAILVADVMGHGVASALYTMQLRSLWEECRASLQSPSRFMTQMNHRLYRLASPDGYFATAVFLNHNARTGSLVYVQAGHPSPFLFRRSRLVERFDQMCPALGLMDEVDYTETSLTLYPRESLLVFTDGALEILDAQGHELGEEGLVNLIQSLGIDRFTLQEIERRLLEYTRSIRLPDDLTLLSLRRTEAGRVMA